MKHTQRRDQITAERWDGGGGDGSAEDGALREDRSGLR